MIRIYIAVSTALVLFSSVHVMAGNDASGYPIDGNLKIQSFESHKRDLDNCSTKSSHKPPRGEYETQQEYEQRLNKFKSGCSVYKRIEQAKIIIPVRLQYDVDREFFSFSLPADTGGAKIDYTSIVGPESFPPTIYESDYKERGFSGGSSCGLCGYKRVNVNNVGKKFSEDISINKKYFYAGSVNGYHRLHYKAIGEKRWDGGYVTKKHTPWEKQHSGYRISSIGFTANTPVQTARQIKTMEKNLEIVLDGKLDVERELFSVRFIKLINRERDDIMATIE